MTHIPAATRYMVLLGRTYAGGAEKDYETVNALQAQYKITPHLCEHQDVRNCYESNDV